MTASRNDRCRLLAAVALAAVVAAGCGSTSPAPPKTVNVSLTAPTDGAVVGVQDIDVVGSVEPSSAVVHVNRARAHVAMGAFASRLTLHPGLNRINVIATAQGYEPTTVSVRLRFHPRAGVNPVPTARHRSATESFQAQANHACTVADGAYALLPRPTNTTEELQDLVRVIAIQARLNAQLRAITPPRAQAHTYKALIHAAQSGLAAAQQELADFRTNDLTDVAAQVRRLQRLVPEVQRDTRALGLRECLVSPNAHG